MFTYLLHNWKLIPETLEISKTTPNISSKDTDISSLSDTPLDLHSTEFWDTNQPNPKFWKNLVLMLEFLTVWDPSVLEVITLTAIRHKPKTEMPNTLPRSTLPEPPTISGTNKIFPDLTRNLNNQWTKWLFWTSPWLNGTPSKNSEKLWEPWATSLRLKWELSTTLAELSWKEFPKLIQCTFYWRLKFLNTSLKSELNCHLPNCNNCKPCKETLTKKSIPSLIWNGSTQSLICTIKDTKP